VHELTGGGVSVSANIPMQDIRKKNVFNIDPKRESTKNKKKVFHPSTASRAKTQE
jgi:hypothetical protein